MAKVKKKPRKKYQSKMAQMLKEKVFLDQAAIDILLEVPVLKEADVRDAHRWFYALYQGNIDSMDRLGIEYTTMPRIVEKGHVPKGWCRCHRCQWRANVKKDVYGHYCHCSIKFDCDGNMLPRTNADGCSDGVEGDPIKEVM